MVIKWIQLDSGKKSVINEETFKTRTGQVEAKKEEPKESSEGDEGGEEDADEAGSGEAGGEEAEE